MNDFDPNPQQEDDSVVSSYLSTTVGASILGLVFLLGVPGNLFIVWSLIARLRKRSVTALLILNLACADGVLALLSVFFVVYLSKRTWVFGEAVCKLLCYVTSVNLYASVFLITLMSVHRLVVVVWPPQATRWRSRWTAKRVIVVMWVVVLIVAFPTLIFRGLVEVPDSHNNTRLVCTVKLYLPTHVRLHFTFETVVGFILPYAIIIFSYVLILQRLRQIKFRRKVRGEKLVLAIVVTFGICWLPWHVVNMLRVAVEWYPDTSPTRKTLEHFYKSISAVTTTLAFISSCANPILYTFAGKSYFRQNGLSFVARFFEGTGSTTNEQTMTIRKTEMDVL